MATVTVKGEHWVCRVGERTYQKLATPESDVVQQKGGRGEFQSAFVVFGATRETFAAACERHAARHDQARGKQPKRDTDHPTEQAEHQPEPIVETVEGPTRETGAHEGVQTMLDI